MTTCAVCEQPVDTDAAHYQHEMWCDPNNICRCDQPVHPECCKECDDSTDQ